MVAQQPFSLHQIADWQLNQSSADGSKAAATVALPPMQRGFVWKPAQAEMLWDSLLRGFPVGAFLLVDQGDEKYLLLDGQQRATCIALGFYNPWEEERTRSSSLRIAKLPVVWIDLMPPENALSDGNLFSIRVVTQAHPWGYRAGQRTEKLSASQRFDAFEKMKKFTGNKGKGYTELEAKTWFPYDAGLPVPLSFVLQAFQDAPDAWRARVAAQCKVHLPESLSTLHWAKEGGDYYQRVVEALKPGPVTDHLEAGLRKVRAAMVPGIVVGMDVLEAGKEEGVQDPTLFVRLNTAGTRLEGEELIYSMYKAAFRQAKDIVEHAGAGFVAPSRVVVLAARLALAGLGDGYPAGMSLSDFKRRIKDEVFRESMNELVGEDKEQSPLGALFKRAIDVLLAKGSVNVPEALVKQLVKSQPELFMVLLRWLQVNRGDVDANTQRRIIGTFTGLAWFGLDNGGFARSTWPMIGHPEFWSSKTLASATEGQAWPSIFPLVEPALIREFLIEEVVEQQKQGRPWYEMNPKAGDTLYRIYAAGFQARENIKEEDYVGHIWHHFRDRLLSCRPMVLFAQRDYVNKTFPDFNQLEDLEDTSVPWDWDHIYPSSWIDGKWYVDWQTRHWNDTIGNLRAISFEKNRSENARVSPEKRLNEPDDRDVSFIRESNWADWQKLTDKIVEDNEDLRKAHKRAIVNRICDIYDKWYQTLGIGGLFVDVTA